MKRTFLAFTISAMLALAAAGASRADVNVSINLPAIALKPPQAVVVIPGTYVYFAPGLDIAVFFHQGYWWRPHNKRWYRAAELGDAWVLIESRKVPGALLKIPPGYRDTPPGLERIPYGHAKKNWKRWEKERRWDRPGKGPKEKPGKGVPRDRGRD
ncbi:MAG: hypothetical protein H3C68_05290 [Deltaproteobacteria bacterium]|nr:hypothetical protein [Deltaproteobacteria bacterium]MBZ0220143.1 hypothetical protein [Deltaproteobacteria bacterium]